MIETVPGGIQHPLIALLRDILQRLAPYFTVVEPNQYSWASSLRHEVQTMLHTMPSDSPFRPFLLSSCQMIPQLGPKTLAGFLTKQGLPAARFLSEPPPSFDCALVPVDEDIEGSGFIWYFSDSLTLGNIYYLLAHTYGHLALGHLRKGDHYSHYDVLSTLKSPAGPTRRWDRAVQHMQSLWFQPLAIVSMPLVEDIKEWKLAGVASAFERLCANQVDDMALLIQEIVSHYDTRLLQVDFDLERDAQLFPHQKRGAAELAVRLQKLGVALLADSVGLGKTRTTATLIKILRQHELLKQAAVLTPSKLAHNWREELARLQLTVGFPGDKNVDVVIVNKDKFKRLDRTEAREEVRGCDLLVIEEAHQDMRNAKNKFYRNVREVAIDKYGLLVTATPWNNRRGDIFTMLSPFATNTRGKERPVQVFSCFSQAFQTGLETFEQDTQIFRQVYNFTTLQRTRRQLRESGDTAVFYAQRHPHLVEVVYTPEQRKAFSTLLDKIEELRLPHFNPLRYLTSTDSSALHLSGIHRFTLLKRAESSMKAFSHSLAALAEKAISLRKELESIEGDEAAIAQWLKQRYSIEEQDTEEEFDWENSTELLPHPKARMKKVSQIIDVARRAGQLRPFRQTLLDDCYHDEQIIRSIQQDFHSLLTRDPKLDNILRQVMTSISNGHKVLCISQFADTAYAVYQHLLHQPLLRQRGVGLVMGGNKETANATQINGLAASREQVLRRFAPNSWAGAEKKKQGKVEEDELLPMAIDIVVGTDTLSVGQNLQDARVLINLDLCWNPMLHEQRIGRIDRPRHHSDSAPLDIFYFLNLDLIESELRLHQTIDKRLTAMYKDTAFDDEILPGYFEMIEQFHKLRQAQAPEKTFVAEADAILEAIAEKTARPPDVESVDNEQELAALLRLQEYVSLHTFKESSPEHQLVNIGRIPLTDLHGLLQSDLPDAAIIAEIIFQQLDFSQHPIGQPIYRRFFLALHASEAENSENISITSDALAPVVDGLLSEPATIPVSKRHIAHLTSLLLRLENEVQKEQHVLETTQKRARRYQHSIQAYGKDEHQTSEQDVSIFAVSARLTNVRFLV
jgi:hypothetical protein